MEKIIAAGGLVLNDKNELLMIFRKGKWDLPKGKLDEGETIEACALREVEEETGLKEITLDGFAGVTFHEYQNPHNNNQDTIKETHWYNMHVAGNQPLIPQTDENIEVIEWVPENKVAEKLSNSYKNIIEIISKLQF